MTLLAVVAVGCGGNSSTGAGGGGGGNSPDFTLAASPSSLTLSQGGTGSTTVTVTALNGFSGTVSLQTSGLPGGVTVSPSNVQITAGGTQVLTFAAAGTAPVGSSSAVVTGVSGGLNHTVKVGLTIQGLATYGSVGRTKYVRTDSVTEYGGAINSEWIVYHAATNRFFVADPAYNRIVVMNAATETEVGTIAVPGAYGIDLTPDGSVLYAGTQVGDVYAIDPVGMAVTHRYVASTIGPNGYDALTVHVLANGDLVLLGSAGGIAAVDGSSSFGVWNIASNSLALYTTPYGAGGMFGSSDPYTVICSPLENIAAFTISGDRTKVLLGSADSDGTICSFDAATQQAVTAQGEGEFIFHLTATPDGKYVLEPNQQGSEVAVYDAGTLALIRNIPVVDTSSATVIAVSADSKTMYLNNGNAIYAYSIATGAMTGWMPGLIVEPESGGYGVGSDTGPNFQAVDGTGLLVGPMEEGVGFVDTTALQTGPVGTLFTNAYLTPATGPLAGGSSVTWGGSSTGTLTGVSFNGVAASFEQDSDGQFMVSTPAGSAGPADVYAFMADGGVQIIPDAFSYGPTLLEATVNASTAEGGGTGWLYGYGFGPVGTSTIPSDLKVSVGGTPVTVTAYEPNAYDNASPPFLLQALSYTIPAGAATTNASVTVTTASGSATLDNAITYLPALQQYPLSGAALAQGVYDSTRSLYYFTDAGAIQVFSKAQGKWLSPIAVPAAPVGMSHRLWGIALSQDGSKLAVSDPSTEMIYLLNPTTAAAQSFAVPQFVTSGTLYLPAGLVVSNSGMVYFTMGDYGGTGYPGYYKLDTSTGTFLNYGIDNPGFGYGDLQLRAQILADDSEVIFNDDGQLFAVTTATDAVKAVGGGPGCCYGDYDLALASGQGTVEASSVLFDGSLNPEASFVYNDREVSNLSYVYGLKLSADGRLAFQPSTNGMDVFDGRLGTLRNRIAFPIALSENFDALVSDGQDNVLIAITGETGYGIAILDLSGLAEPAALPYVSHGGGSIRSAPVMGVKLDAKVVGQKRSVHGIHHVSRGVVR